MKNCSHSAFIAPIIAAFALCAAQPSAANPLCASPEQRQKVQSALTGSPTSSSASIAGDTGISEAAVTDALPADTRTPISMGEFERLWQELTEWEDALVIVLSSGSVFELAGPLPKGDIGRGYFNFDSPESTYGGHLKVDRLAAIYLLSSKGHNGETHQVAFYDHNGRRVFSVYVPRDEDGNLQTQPHNRFLRMRRDYGALAKRTLLKDASCLWEVSADQ